MNRFAVAPAAMEQNSDELAALRARMMTVYDVTRSALTVLNAMEGFSQVLTPLTRLTRRFEDQEGRLRRLSRTLQTAAGLYRQSEERCVDMVSPAAPTVGMDPGRNAYREPEWYISPAKQTMISRDVLNAIFR